MLTAIFLVSGLSKAKVKDGELVDTLPGILLRAWRCSNNFGSALASGKDSLVSEPFRTKQFHWTQHLPGHLNILP